MTEETKEIDLLKARADQLGISYSNSIGVDTLRSRINDHLEGKDADEKGNEDDLHSPAAESKAEYRQRKYKEAMRMRRVRITLMNTKKAGIPGEIFSVSNDIIGTVKKMIPFDDDWYVNGYHVPQCLLDQIAEKKFLFTKVIKDRVTGRERIDTSFIREFAIEYLPDLTKEELAELAKEQAAANNID